MIDADGTQLGVVDLAKARDVAESRGLDLVEVSPTAKPPVCRILDYGKYKYEEAKKTKAAKAKQHIIKTKEIKLHPKTDTNDYSYRLERGKEFLAKGYKLKVTVVFRGRELAHLEYGSRWLTKIQEDLQGFAEPEVPIKKEGRNMSTIFVPVKHTSKTSRPKPEKTREPDIKES